MSNAVHKHLIRYPHARTSTIQYLAKRDEITAQLRREISDMNSRPRSEGAVRRMMRGIAALVARMPV
ncbi:hypothetical protein IB244_17170 [Rhizobium sp. RHZ02]|uniref:hypothetical protein n=1 Tax=Rhizobium sp. RHZ02 TaxID=2769306 RepID=UPI00178269B4|nr:hypothetical protein [Rhizobium sp. RHZ02]MBD9453276.1 hypothetical protein [Rhizobium sp. RHZ02]